MNLIRASLLTIIFLLTPFCSSLADQLDPLPVEQAFILKASIEPKTGEIKLNWQIAPQHYLYQEKIHVFDTSSHKKSLPLTLPKAKVWPDALLGDQLVYENRLTLTFTPPEKTTGLSIHYQGCSAEGFCYPPQTMAFTLEYKNQIHSLSPILPEHKSSSLHESATEALEQANTPTRLALFYLVGLLLAFTPCVLPMLPILASVIITEDKLSTLKGFFLSLSYVLSMATTYALAGILAVKMGQSVQVFFQNPWVMSLFALFFVYLGLVQLEKLPLKLPSKLMDIFHKLHHKQQGGHIFGAIILGFLGTLISSPCVTAPLVATLSYISQSGNTFLGGSSLFVMGLGMGTPMILLGTLGGRFIPKAGKWMQLVNELFAVLLFGLAIWIISSMIPPTVSMGLWGILALLAGYFMGFFNNRKYRYLPKIGMIIFIYGLVLILGALLGNTNPLRPFDLNSFNSGQSTQHVTPNFITVTNLEDLNSELKKYPNKIILIDFYAEWCIACKHIDIELFQDPEIIPVLKNVILIKADITDNQSAQRELMKAYQVFAPPSIYLFNSNRPSDSVQFHGEVDKQEFISELTKFFKK
jgi:thiol:disulfide interchange protein DsbD